MMLSALQLYLIANLLWLRIAFRGPDNLCSADFRSLGRRLQRVAEQVACVSARRWAIRTSAWRHSTWWHATWGRAVWSDAAWRHAALWRHSAWRRTLRSDTAWWHSVWRRTTWTTHRRTIWSRLVRIHWLIRWRHSLASWALYYKVILLISYIHLLLLGRGTTWTASLSLPLHSIFPQLFCKFSIVNRCSSNTKTVTYFILLTLDLFEAL